MLGIPTICLFPYIDTSYKTELCEEAWNPDNLSNRATRAIKDAAPGITVMTDVALDPYNINGHDGIVRDGVIVNDESVDALVRMALAQAAEATGYLREFLEPAQRSGSATETGGGATPPRSVR